MTKARRSSLRRRMATLRDFATPLSNEDTSRVPHCVLHVLSGCVEGIQIHPVRHGESKPNHSRAHRGRMELRAIFFSTPCFDT